jgi:hypothetical protein
MVYVRKCDVVSCNRNAKDERNSFKRFMVPSVITHQGPYMKELTNRRRVMWLKRLNVSTSSCKKLYVCDAHFISGIP